MTVWDNKDALQDAKDFARREKAKTRAINQLAKQSTPDYKAERDALALVVNRYLSMRKAVEDESLDAHARTLLAQLAAQKETP
jgi:hypothetical protein